MKPFKQETRWGNGSKSHDSRIGSWHAFPLVKCDM